MKNQLYVIGLVLVTLSASLLSSCKKLIEIDPPTTSQTSANVFNSDETAVAVLTGQYAAMSNYGQGSIYSFATLNSGLAADELITSGVANDRLKLYYQNSYSSNNIGNAVWDVAYSKLYGINDAIERLERSTGLTLAVKRQLQGEAKFLRAFYYFYLVEYYGDVPLVLTTDFTVNEKLAKLPKDLVIKQIISDLSEASELLSVTFLSPNLLSTTDERLRPTRWAALALLARINLYLGKFQDAELNASAIIDASPIFSLVKLDEVFLKNNREAIWQLQPVDYTRATFDANVFIIPSSGFDGDHSVYLSDFLLNAFETGDERRIKWIGTWLDTESSPAKPYFFPNKYKVAITSEIQEYNTVFRLSEQFLIRAEARAQLGITDGALKDLDLVRDRAGLNKYEGQQDKTSLINAILKERRVELFAEMGHRWFDLKRTGNLDQVMQDVSLSKGSVWAPYKALLPISQSQLLKSPNVEQTFGYNN